MLRLAVKILIPVSLCPSHVSPQPNSHLLRVVITGHHLIELTHNPKRLPLVGDISGPVS